LLIEMAGNWLMLSSGMAADPQRPEMSAQCRYCTVSLTEVSVMRARIDVLPLANSRTLPAALFRPRGADASPAACWVAWNEPLHCTDAGVVAGDDATPDWLDWVEAHAALASAAVISVNE
jgi:hypothetical protein